MAWCNDECAILRRKSHFTLYFHQKKGKSPQGLFTNPVELIMYITGVALENCCCVPVKSITAQANRPINQNLGFQCCMIERAAPQLLNLQSVCIEWKRSSRKESRGTVQYHALFWQAWRHWMSLEYVRISWCRDQDFTSADYKPCPLQREHGHQVRAYITSTPFSTCRQCILYILYSIYPCADYSHFAWISVHFCKQLCYQ